MSIFIKLHESDGIETYVNMDKVSEFFANREGRTVVVGSDYRLSVKETPKEIMWMLREENKK